MPSGVTPRLCTMNIGTRVPSFEVAQSRETSTASGSTGTGGEAHISSAPPFAKSQR